MKYKFKYIFTETKVNKIAKLIQEILKSWL